MNFDCIVVLANEMDKEGNLNKESEARIKLASDTYLASPVEALITCGWDYRKDCKLCIGDVLKKYAEALGVPSEKIITELHSRDTVGDAFFTKKNIIRNNGWKKLLVVTSDYHVARTSKIFEFIYGPQYKIVVIGAASSDPGQKQTSEIKSNAAFESTFVDVEKGDDLGITQRLLTRHPYYNGELHPRIDLEF